MRSSPGRWVHGDDFFGREVELALLAERVADGNHVLLTGQRRMGKTSLARELGRRLQRDGWLFFFLDLEEARSPQDVVALVAQQLHSVRPLARRFASTMARLAGNVEEVSAYDSASRSAPTSMRAIGGVTARNCSRPSPTSRSPFSSSSTNSRSSSSPSSRRERDGRERVDEFLTWLRAVQQNVAGRGLTFVVSGSIGLVPLATRLGIPDRINHLHAFRLQPWRRDAAAQCLSRLAASYGLSVEPGVAAAAVEKLGIGIPHHVQSFFAHLREDAMIRGRTELRLEAVDRVYRESLLAPWGQTDLMHYDTRLRDAFDDRSHRTALEILTEAATQGGLSEAARDRFEAHLAALGDEAQGRIAAFQSRLLRDWWVARFGRGHEPFENRAAAIAGDER